MLRSCIACKEPLRNAVAQTYCKKIDGLGFPTMFFLYCPIMTYFKRTILYKDHYKTNKNMKLCYLLTTDHIMKILQ